MVTEIIKNNDKGKSGMGNCFRKEYKWIVIVIVTIVIFTACGKEKDEQKMETSVLGIEDQYDSRDNGEEICDTQLSEAEDLVREPLRSVEENDIETVNVVGESMEDGGEIFQTEEESKEDEWNVDFEIIGTEYTYIEQRNEIIIYYPQLSGLQDLEKENRINALIEEDVKKIIGEKNKEGDDTLYCIDLDYKIKFLSKRMISILYEGSCGYVMPGRSCMNPIAIATTIDIKEEKIITLKDIVTDFAELSEMLLADEFENISMWEGKTGIYEVSWDYENREGEIGKDLQAEDRQWYTDGDHFIVVLERYPIYNEYSISNDLVKHILDEEFLKKLE